MHELIPLRLLPAGHRAEVCTISGLSEHARRLQELGFRQGVQVEVLRSGNPCIVRLDNSRLCVRDSEISSILVKTGISG